jgi:hypothetical protein
VHVVRCQRDFEGYEVACHSVLYSSVRKLNVNTVCYKLLIVHVVLLKNKEVLEI